MVERRSRETSADAALRAAGLRIAVQKPGKQSGWKVEV